MLSSREESDAGGSEDDNGGIGKICFQAEKDSGGEKPSWTSLKD